jgi:hypothetical protein
MNIVSWTHPFENQIIFSFSNLQTYSTRELTNIEVCSFTSGIMLTFFFYDSLRADDGLLFAGWHAWQVPSKVLLQMLGKKRVYGFLIQS